MIVALNLPTPIAAAIAIESSRHGVTVAHWIEDRLSDWCGMRPTANSSAVSIVTGVSRNGAALTIHPETTNEND